MDSNLDNRLTSAIAVRKVGDLNLTIIEQVPALKEAFADLGNKIREIQESRKFTETGTKGITEEKGRVSLLLAEKAMETASAIYAFATDSNSHELKGKVNYTSSDFIYCREGLLLDRSRIIYDLAQNNLEALAKYAVTAGDLSDLRGHIENFEDMLAIPRNVRGNRKDANQQLRQQFEELDHIQKERIDRIMEKLKNTYPAFYNAYKNARMIINTGARHEDKGTAENGTTVTTPDNTKTN
jgi:hypothetical protein